MFLVGRLVMFERKEETERKEGKRKRVGEWRLGKERNVCERERNKTHKV